MEKYVGVKLVTAEPSLRDCSCDREEGDNSICKCQEEGYKVVYEDGYTSWSPKHVFEKAYRKILPCDKILIEFDLKTGNWELIKYL